MKKLITILFFASLITGCRKEIETGDTEIGYTKNDVISWYAVDEIWGVPSTSYTETRFEFFQISPDAKHPIGVYDSAMLARWFSNPAKIQFLGTAYADTTLFRLKDK